MPDLEQLSDEQLITRCRNGDARTFSILVQRHIKGIYELCLRMLRSKADAEDAVQETFATAFEKLHLFRGDAAFRTWLHRIASNKALDLSRRRKARTHQLMPGEELESRESSSWFTQATRADPEREALQQLEADYLWQLVGQLKPTQRIVVILFYRQGLSYEEIAEALEIPRRTVETRLYRGRQKLRQLWKEQPGVEAL